MKNEKEMSKIARWNKKYKIFILAAIFIATLAITLVIVIPKVI